jgi:hypothetical protein
MATLEEIIRPFQTPNVAPPKQGVDNVPAVTPDVILIVSGSGGQPKFLNGGTNLTTTVYVIKRPKEVVAA